MAPVRLSLSSPRSIYRTHQTKSLSICLEILERWLSHSAEHLFKTATSQSYCGGFESGGALITPVPGNSNGETSVPVLAGSGPHAYRHEQSEQQAALGLKERPCSSQGPGKAPGAEYGTEACSPRQTKTLRQAPRPPPRLLQWELQHQACTPC